MQKLSKLAYILSIDCATATAYTTFYTRWMTSPRSKSLSKRQNIWRPSTTSIICHCGRFVDNRAVTSYPVAKSVRLVVHTLRYRSRPCSCHSGQFTELSVLPRKHTARHLHDHCSSSIHSSFLPFQLKNRWSYKGVEPPYGKQ